MKKKVELIKVDLTSLVRAVVMVMAIPLIIAAVMGLLRGDPGFLWPLVVSPIMYSLITLLLGVSYNWLAPRFGGIIIEVAVEKGRVSAGKPGSEKESD